MSHRKSSTETEEHPSHQRLVADLAKKVPRPVVLFLVLSTVFLGSLFPLTLKLQGPLLGLGFSESKVLYFDSAPGVSFVTLWLLTILFFPEKATYIFRILVAIFVVSSIIYGLVQYSVIAPSDEAALVIVSIPTLLYTTFFSWRLRQYHLQGKLPKGRQRKE
ncbi:hypothetical protein Gasu2_04330 [Galdieria sulphuraria]|uniref:Uncharacterized protein n=1 Tax=Galdieria sulphuraria TaxID=130081 RepID=M2WZI0_GALSU|nr:uncharacterized protein Gasu_31300 [Galdieria sulphuraria]EME29490.1 hypothetical protein Gasu_31300 [Galdieria sulphuraria]GJD05991.1 hypothetical protein Gasu2_04330 [Galdieria sulphuraria]|eukprot:XP_005706010.1 hypothetical protein Gasu_31300 [Galdieria sulphuraria]